MSDFVPHKNYDMLVKQGKALARSVLNQKKATSLLMDSVEDGRAVVEDCVSALEEQCNLNSVQNEVLDEAKNYLARFPKMNIN